MGDVKDRFYSETEGGHSVLSVVDTGHQCEFPLIGLVSWRKTPVLVGWSLSGAAIVCSGTGFRNVEVREFALVPVSARKLIDEALAMLPDRHGLDERVAARLRRALDILPKDLT